MYNILEGLNAAQEKDFRETIVGEMADWLNRQPGPVWVRTMEKFTEAVYTEGGWNFRADIETIKRDFMSESPLLRKGVEHESV